MEGLEGLNSLFTILAGMFVILFAIALAVYIAEGIFLNKLNKLIYGKGTPMAWIPVANIYLLGKLTVNKAVGWVLIICMFLIGSYTTTINGVTTAHTILPEGINSIISKLYYVTIIGLFIYAIVKYFKIKKSAANSDTEISNQPVQASNSMVNSNVNIQPQVPVNAPTIDNTPNLQQDNTNIQTNNPTVSMPQTQFNQQNTIQSQENINSDNNGTT